MNVPVAVASATNRGDVAASMPLHLTIFLTPPNLTAIQAFADSVSDPKNPNYQHFLTPAQFGAKFGASSAVIGQVESYFKQRGFTIKSVAPSNLAIEIDGTAAQAESAFNTSIAQFHSNAVSIGYRDDFYAYTRTLQLPSSIAKSVQSVSGIENSEKPIPRLHPHIGTFASTMATMMLGKQGGTQCLTPTQTRVIYNTAPFYNAGVTGTGRTVGISSFDGFRLTNVPLYYSQYSLATPSGGVGSNITVVAVDGGSGSGTPSGEGDLDIQMVLGMAPTCNLMVYDGGGSLIDVLTKEANDNLVDIVTESYGWQLSASDAEACHAVHLQMTSQGITYMEATGDYGTTLEPYSYSNYEPEVFQVGGTVATVATNGTRVSEVGWSGSGGGWATDAVPFNTLPTWQKGTNVPTNINYRLNPDVALNAAGNPGAYYFYLGGALTNDYDGTSFASPVFAGCLGVSLQKLIALGDITASNGKYRLGRISDLVYQQNGRSDVYYDITSGPSTGQLPNGQAANPGPFWDFCTGWGSVNFSGFVSTFKATGTAFTTAPGTVAVYSGQGGKTSGGVAQLASIDKSYFTEATVVSNNENMAAAVMTYQLTKPISQISSINVKVVANSPQGSSTFIYVKNYTTNNLDLLSTTSANGTDLTITIPLTKYASYVSPSGAMQVVVRALEPTRSGGAYILKMDYAVVTGTLSS